MSANTPLFLPSAGPLPVRDILDDLKTGLQKHNTIILQAPPGAGKSTLLPLALLDAQWLSGQKILMLEPRRLAARAVASRMASLLDENIAETVGYRVRFDNKIGRNTRLEVLTEGILTRMLQSDNALDGVGLVIFDEFHERSLHADLALALCREVQQVLRDDLRILIMSATLDSAALSAMLGNAPVLTSLGRQYPLDLRYTPPEADTPIPKAVAKTVLHALRSHTGDILAFLPGAGEIGRCKTLLENELHDVIICPLYGDLPQREQQQALMPDPGGHRKVVLATSIAETSLTIEGIRVVIDSGYARNPAFDPKSGLSKLETMRVTADAADQRAGRAARLGPGTAYRLWSEGVQYQLIPQRRPEILEADLAPLTLELAAWGVTDPASLSWLTVPPTGTLAQARQLLENLDAMEGGKITDRGRAMLKLPTHPRLAHLMLEAERMNLLPLAADIASLLEERDPLASVSDFPGHLNAGADLSRRAELLRNRRAGERVNGERTVWDRVERSAENWCRIFRIQPDRSSVRSEQVGKLVAAAYPERIARRREEAQNTWRMANGRNARLPDSDPLAAEEWLAIAHTDAGDRDGRIFLAAPLDIRDILPLAREQTVLAWDYRNGTLLSRREKRIGEIVAETKPVHETDPEKVRELLCEVIKKEGLLLFNRTPELLQLQARTQYLRHLRPELALPDLSNEALLENPEKWLSPFLNNIRKKDDFQKTDLGAALNALLGWENTQTLDRLVPDKIKVPSGFHVNLQYFPDDRPPVLAVRIQEVFGLMDTPMVNDGRTGVLLHLLSPGYKPVQVTQDLRSFWQNTYNIIRKELKIRYPRHFWPEDPWTAEAVRGVKRNEAGQAIRK